mgnify:FL=1
MFITPTRYCRLRDLTKKDEEKAKLAAVQNELESFTYDVKNKLYEEEYEECSTDEEREQIREKLNEIMEWYEEQPLTTPYQVMRSGTNLYQALEPHTAPGCRSGAARMLWAASCLNGAVITLVTNYLIGPFVSILV